MGSVSPSSSAVRVVLHTRLIKALSLSLVIHESLEDLVSLPKTAFISYQRIMCSIAAIST